MGGNPGGRRLAQKRRRQVKNARAQARAAAKKGSGGQGK
jgi:hypothetical protein